MLKVLEVALCSSGKTAALSVLVYMCCFAFTKRQHSTSHIAPNVHLRV